MLNKYIHITALTCLSVIYLAAAPDEGPIPYQEPQPRYDIEMRTDNHQIIMGRDNQGDGQGDLVWDVPLAQPRNKQEQPPVIIRPEIYPQLPGYIQPGYTQPGTNYPGTYPDGYRPDGYRPDGYRPDGYRPGTSPSYRPGQNPPPPPSRSSR